MPDGSLSGFATSSPNAAEYGSTAPGNPAGTSAPRGHFPLNFEEPRNGGPKLKMTPNKIAQARSMYDAGQHTVQEIADTFGVSRPTIYRHLAPPGRAEA